MYILPQFEKKNFFKKNHANDSFPYSKTTSHAFAWRTAG